jgi:hypothetical protein
MPEAWRKRFEALREPCDAGCAGRAPRPYPARFYAARDPLANQQMHGRYRPIFSFEFFPPKTTRARARSCLGGGPEGGLEPDFVSVTYGAGGSTRDARSRS